MSSDDRSIYNLLPIPLLILCLLYVMIAGMAAKRYWGFTQARYIGMLGKLYYGLLFAESLIRTILFILLGVASMGGMEDKTSESAYLFGMNIIYIPEFLIWISCTLLFWQYLIMFYISHINFSLSSRAGDPLPVPLRVKSFNTMIFLIVLFVIIQAIFVILYNTNNISLDFLLLEDMTVNFSCSLIAIITQFVLHLKFSGAPYVSNIYKEKKKRMTLIIIYWILARMFKATFSVVLYSYNGDIVNDFTDDSAPDKNNQSIQLVEIVIFFINYFFAEIIAFSLTLNNSVANIFQLYQYSNPFKEANVFLIQENSNPFEKHSENRLSRNELHEQSDSNINIESLFQNLDLSKLNFDDRFIASTSSNKFGSIRKASYFSRMMAVRTIEVENVSSFIIEEVQEDMVRLIKLDWKIVNPIKGLFYDKTKLILMSDFLDEPTLEQYMSKPPDLGINEEDPKLKLALELAGNLLYMHENNIIHGHLTPNNIFVGKDLKVKLTDFGFRGLKKLISLQRGYSNKTKYTAPEHLKERTNTVKTVNPGSDVYSFGLILWELLENKKAFEHVNMKDLVVYVVEKQNRPKISEGINENLSKLIRACWQEEVDKRPSFKVICKILEQNAPVN